MIRLTPAGAAVLAFTAAAPVAHAQGYTYSAFNFLFVTDQTTLYGVNTSGEVAGIYSSTTKCAYKTARKRPVKFIYPFAVSTTCDGLNNNGVIVGYYIQTGTTGGFTYDGTTFTPLFFPGSKKTYALGINDLGVTSGYYQMGPIFHGFTHDAAGYHAYDYPGARSTYIQARNNAGQSIVRADFAQPPATRWMLLSGGASRVLNPPGVATILAGALNNTGKLTLNGVAADGSFLSYVYDIAVNTYTPVAFPGTAATSVLGISDTGVLVGSYLVVPNSQRTGFIAQPQP